MTRSRRWPVVMLAAWGALLCAGCSRDDPQMPAASNFRRLDEPRTAEEPASVAAVGDSTDQDPTTSVDEQRQYESAPRLSADLHSRLPEQAETIFRPSDQRPRYGDARAAELGIARYESQRLRLYTDIDPAIARTLPPLFDQAYDAWSDYFGPLPPDREGTEFQVTGFIMQDRDRFAAAGMFPEQAQALLVHGIHRRNEFWMDAQEYDDYRRHLMIHEGTHCFMTVMPGAPLPVWYLEGMAELFGAHTIDADGRTTFRVMPETPGNYVGFGRVEMIHQAIQDGKYRSAQGVTELSVEEFAASRTDPYAWTWALCKFLDTHPRYRERFRDLARHLDGNEFARGMQSSFAPDLPVLWVEWELFARNLVYGYDIERAAIDFRRGEPLPEGGSIAADVRADKGWQSSGVWVEAGRAYDIQASGEVSLAQTPKPWISQPPGVSIRYASGQPIGRLVAGVQSETPPDENGVGALWHVIDVGAAATVTPAVDGTLYFRVNDFWNEVADNQGEYRVTVRPGR